jgi:hypothetical protein
MIRKLLDLQKRLDLFFDEDWQFSWLPDGL